MFEVSTWYRVGRKYSTKIESVEVEKQTPKKLTIICKDWNDKPYKRTQMKESAYELFFPTWLKAHEFLRERTERDLVSAREALAEADAEYLVVREMTP